MRVAVIGPTHPFRGGIAQHTTLLVEALRARHDVLFVSYRGQYPSWVFPGRSDRDPSRSILRGDVEYLLAPLRPWSWPRTARRVAGHQPDITVIPWWVPFWAPSIGCVVRLLGRSAGRLLYVCHNVAPHEGPAWLSRQLTRFALEPGDAFVVHSVPDAERLGRLLPGRRGRPRDIRRALLPDHAIAEPVPRREARRLLGLAPDERLALFFGFVRPYKGVDQLVRAVALAAPAVPDLRLLVAGESWLAPDATRSLARELGIADRVTVVDRYVPNDLVAPYFCAADVVVLPYLEATQSGVVTLASRFGVPVIATNVGGLPEAVLDGVTGLIVPPSDAAALARALQAVLTDGALARSLREGVEAHRWRFGWPALVDLIEAVATDSPASSEGLDGPEGPARMARPSESDPGPSAGARQA